MNFRTVKYFLPVAFAILFSVRGYTQSAPQPISLQTADSVFFAQDWANAANLYKKLLKDTSSNSLEWNRLGFALYHLGNYDAALISYQKSMETHPSPALQPFLYSRVARVYAFKNNSSKVIEYLNKAAAAGYTNFDELDTLQEYAAFKQDTAFRAVRNKVYAVSYPCFADPTARAFDFWVGEWDAYVTGTTNLAGHSLIQIASGGCMILENWTSTGAPYSGKSMNFIDNTTGKWQQVWVGSEGSGQHVFVNGEYRDSAMRFDFEQKDATGNMQKGKFTFYNQGPDKVRQLNETSADDGKTWITVYDFTYIRKKNS